MKIYRVLFVLIGLWLLTNMARFAYGEEGSPLAPTQPSPVVSTSSGVLQSETKKLYPISIDAPLKTKESESTTKSASKNKNSTGSCSVLSFSCNKFFGGLILLISLFAAGWIIKRQRSKKA